MTAFDHRSRDDHPREWLQRTVLLGPAVAWALVFVAGPVVMAFVMSFWDVRNFRLVHTFGLHNYIEFASTPIYRDPLFTALLNGLLVALVCVALSLPVAHYIHFRARRWKLVLLGGMIVALWLGYLLRIFGWRVLLGQRGVVNSLLIDAGIIDEPLSFLVFSRFAVILAQTHLALPFAFLPIYLVVERLPRELLDAAADLYAGPLRRYAAVELPLISSGVITGAMFAFVIAFGDYIAPVLVGGPGLVTIGNVAADQFGATFNWPLGAAVGSVMAITVLLLIAVPDLVSRLARRRQAAS